MDSLLPRSILSVLLQRLPVHRGTANPAPLTLPSTAPAQPGSQIHAQKPSTSGRQEEGPFQSFFSMQGDWNPTKAGQQAEFTPHGWALEVQGHPESSCGYPGDPHPLQLLGILPLPAQGICSFLGFKVLCVSLGTSPQNPPLKLNPASKVTPSIPHQLSWLLPDPWRRWSLHHRPEPAASFNWRMLFLIYEAFLGKKKPQYLLFQGVFKVFWSIKLLHLAGASCHSMKFPPQLLFPGQIYLINSCFLKWNILVIIKGNDF